MITTNILISFFVGAIGAWGISRYGNSLFLMDKASARSSHVGETPKGGGGGILVVILLMGAFYEMPFLVLTGALVVSLVSLSGDIKDLSVKVRLVVQFICAAMVVCSIEFDNLYILPFCILYIVGTSNFYNFMDGINGIAGMTATVAFCFLSYYTGQRLGLYGVSLFCLCVASSCLGFLPWNIPKAKVFLGDVGSVLIGFVFSSVVLIASKSFEDFLCMAGFLFLFYFDELICMGVRLKQGDSLVVPHRKHIYQLLVNELKIPHWKVSVLYSLLQILVCCSLLVAVTKGVGFILLTYLFYLMIFSPISFWIRKKALI